MIYKSKKAGTVFGSEYKFNVKRLLEIGSLYDNQKRNTLLVSRYCLTEIHTGLLFYSDLFAC